MKLKLKYLFRTDKKVYEDFLVLFVDFLTTGEGREEVMEFSRFASSRPAVARKVYNLLYGSKWRTKSQSHKKGK